ncbi:MAG TPA: cell shape determination protein CcmA [Clostridiaceae bacterium]|nr:cell shape determination protein CcmA [Clostridiaceae bacterium]
MDNIKNSETTIIGPCSKFEGKLKAEGIVRIDGTIGGELSVNGNVIVGEEGYIKGSINSEKVVIAGKVEGNIHCSGSLELTSSGKLYGDIEAKNIIIQDGAEFQGKCIMIKDSYSQDENTDELVDEPVDNNDAITSEPEDVPEEK